MKSKIFLTVLLLAAITTIGISQEKQSQLAKDFDPDAFLAQAAEKDRIAEEERIAKLPDAVRSLVGVKGMYVAVEELKEDAKSAGLTEEQLKTVVELKLRLAGIKVNSMEEMRVSEDRTFIYVNVCTTSRNDSPNITYFVSVRFHQRVLLIGRPFTAVSGLTWDDGVIGTDIKNKFQEVARRKVKEQMDTFLNDYLKANPKK